MTQRDVSTGNGMRRRDVLRAAALAGAVGSLGVGAFPGVGAAQTQYDHQFYTVFPYRGRRGGRRYLVGFDPEPDSDGYIEGQAISLGGDWASSLGNDAVGTLAFAPDGTLYAWNTDTGAIVTIDVATGEVAEQVGPTGALDTVPGGCILEEGGTTYFYGVKEDTNELLTVNLSDGTYTAVPLLVDDSWTVDEGTPLRDVYRRNFHLGLAVDFTTESIVGVIGNSGNTYGTSASDVVSIDRDGSVHLVAVDAVSQRRQLGLEVDPCADMLYSMHGGADLYTVAYGESVTATKVGSVYIDRNGNGSYDEDIDWLLNVSALASPWPEDGCESTCEDCGTADPLAKYEFACTEGYEEDGEWVCTAYSFVIEGTGDDTIAYEGYTGKAGEPNDPWTATFTTEYCGLTAVVKAGTATEVQYLEPDDDGVVVIRGITETRTLGNGTEKTTDHAISNVVFYCADSVAVAEEPAVGTSAVDSEVTERSSNGRGKARGRTATR